MSEKNMSLKHKDSYSHIEKNIARNIEINEKLMETKRQKKGRSIINNYLLQQHIEYKLYDAS